MEDISITIELALWSGGRVEGSQLDRPRFDPHVR